MAKKTHLAAITKTGIVESVTLAWINGLSDSSPWKLSDWQKQVLSDNTGGAKFQEVTDAELKAGLADWDKNNERVEIGAYKRKIKGGIKVDPEHYLDERSKRLAKKAIAELKKDGWKATQE